MKISSIAAVLLMGTTVMMAETVLESEEIFSEPEPPMHDEESSLHETDGVMLDGIESLYNTFYGLDAGKEGGGKWNSFFGRSAGYSNTAYHNTFIGDSSGYSNTNGGSNTFTGFESGYSNTSSSGNTFTGYQSGYHNLGYYNTFTGTGSGYNNTTGSYNTFSGDGSGYENTTGNHNTFTGFTSGKNNTTGDHNTFSGNYSGYSNTEGTRNTFSGFQSGYSNIDGNDNTFSGFQSGFSNIISHANTFSGYGSGYYNTTGSINTFSGNKSGYSNTTGYSNTFSGNKSGYRNTTGKVNTFIGDASGYSNTTGHGNTFSGYQSGYNANISSSVLLGHKAGYNATRDYTLYISNSDTESPLIYGEFDNDLVVINGDFETTGYITSALDEDNTLKVEFPVALSRTNNASGEHSDVGFSLENKTDGHNGSFKWSFQTSWFNEGFTATKDGTGGYEFVVKNPTDDVNKVELAAAGKTFFKNGALVNPSSRAFKDDIKTLDTKAALEAFAKLEPVTFVYKEHKSEQVVGFIAEDVPELVAINGRDGVNATEIVAVLTKVLTETRVELNKAQEKIAKLEAMQKRLSKVESLLINLSLDTSNTKTEKVSLSNK